MSEEIVSPVVNMDRSVTLNFRSEHAKKVEIAGDFRLGRKEVIPISSTSFVPMKKTSDNVWTITTEPVPPGIYRYAFIVDGELKVLDPHNPWMRRVRMGQPYSMVKVDGDEPMPWDLIEDIPHGKVVRETLYSETLKQVKRCFVYLPPGYVSSEEYPVLYLLHGGGNDYANWVFDGTADNIMDYLISKGEAKEMLIAMPDGNVRPTVPRSGVRRTVSTAPRTAEDRERYYERHVTYFTKDVMPFIESRYRVSNESRAIAGLSMGGMQTFNLITNHPEKFVAAGLFSGSPRGEVRDRLRAVEVQLKSYKFVYVSCGNVDRNTLLEGSRTLASLLEELRIPHTYFECEGGHIWYVWQRSLVNFVSRFSKALS